MSTGQARFDPTFSEQNEPSEEQLRMRRVAAQSRELIVALGALLRQLRMHAADNASVVNQLASTKQKLHDTRVSEGTLTLVFAEGHTFVNGVWVRATRLMWEHSTYMTDLFAQINTRGFSLDANFNDEHITHFCQNLLRGHKMNLKGGAMPDLKIPGLALIPIDSEGGDENEEGPLGRKAFRAQARQIIRDGLIILDDHKSTPKLDLSMRRRQSSLIQNLIALAEQSTEDLLALTTVRDPTRPEATHGLMVTIYSIAIGKLMGLLRRDLMRLGATALNHNIGNTLLKQGFTDQRREFTPAERQYVETHPLLGMSHIIKEYGFKTGMIARAIVAAEHHIRWDGQGGYPFPIPRKPHPFSRIIAISDTFHALLSERPHRQAYPPDQALKLTIRSADKQLDPVLIRVLMGLVGRYPAGSVVELDTGEWGIVVGPGRGVTPLKRPRVLLITDEDGFECDELVLIDLGERHPRRKAWLRTIIRTQDPKRLEQEVSTYLFADRTELPPQKLDVQEFEEAKARKARRARR